MTTVAGTLVSIAALTLLARLLLVFGEPLPYTARLLPTANITYGILAFITFGMMICTPVYRQFVRQANFFVRRATMGRVTLIFSNNRIYPSKWMVMIDRACHGCIWLCMQLVSRFAMQFIKVMNECLSCIWSKRQGLVYFSSNEKLFLHIVHAYV